MKRLLRITTVPISLKLLLTEQMKFMKAKGFEVVMVSSDGPEVGELEYNEGCRHEVIPLSRTISPISDLYCLIQLIRLIRRVQPDIVHTHTPKAGLLGMVAARLCSVPVRLHTIAGLPLMTAIGVKRRILIFTERITSWGAHKVLPNSESIMKYMKEQGLAPDHKLDMIGMGSSNGIDLNRYKPERLNVSKIKEYTSKHNSQNKFLILSVGRVVRDKGIVELVDAFVELEKGKTECKLLLLGPMESIRSEESLPERTLALIESHDNIEHVPWSGEVEYFMSIASILVHASHREGFPNVLLQAGAMALPVVCSNIPGNIDLIEDNVDGRWFNRSDVKGLITAISDSIDNVDMSLMFSKNLKAKIERQYERATFHDKVYKYYKNVFSEAKV